MRIVGKVFSGDSEVIIVEVPRMQGYRFDAVGLDSLPFAVELAVLQAQKGIPYIQRRLGIKVADLNDKLQGGGVEHG